MKDWILETRHLTKSYKGQQAVSDISLKIPRNGVYGLLGPNGAGKSTTLKMLTGILRPDSGAVIFDGKIWKREMLSEIGEEVLEIVDLKDTGKKRTAQFSMGMKQRMGIAIALLNHPRLLILDEPTNGLDPFGIQELREMIASFGRQGITVILSSHILSEVSQVVDEIGIISQGRLLFQGVPDTQENLEQFFNEVILKGGKNHERA